LRKQRKRFESLLTFILSSQRRGNYLEALITTNTLEDVEKTLNNRKECFNRPSPLWGEGWVRGWLKSPMNTEQTHAK